MEIFKLFGRIMVDNTNANKELSETEQKAKEAGEEMLNMSEAADVMGAAVAAAAAAFVAGIGVKAVMAADELTKAMNTLQAQTGASDADMRRFEDSAKRLYAANYGESLDDIARSMGEIARTTGLSGKELELTTKNALSLRDTFDMGVNESARTANTLMKQFGISSEEAYTLIAQGAQNGANKNGDLLDTLNEYSVQFKSVGFSAEQFTSILIDGAQNGAWSIDKVGDAMKEFNIVSKDGSKVTAAAFEGLGLNAEEMTKAFASGGQVAQKAFTTVMQRLAAIEDPVKKNAIGVGLFRTQFEDLETESIKALGNIQFQTDQNADTLQKINDVKYDSFGDRLAELGRKIKVHFLMPLGKQMTPALEKLMETLKEVGPELKDSLGTTVDALVGGFNAFAKAIGFLAKNFKIFLPILVGVTAMMTAQLIINTIVPLYKAWRAATVGMTLAQAVLNGVMMANPFGMVALAIGVVIAAVVALVMNWDWVKMKAIEIWGAIASFFSGFWDGFKNMGKAAWEGLRDGLIGSWNWIKEKAMEIWDGIVSFFNGKFGTILKLMMGPIGIGLLIIQNWENIKNAAGAIWDGIVGLIKLAVNNIIGQINVMIGLFEKMVNMPGEAFNKIPSLKIPDWVPGMGGQEYSLPKLPKIDIPEIPMLAEGGMIREPGRVLVGEQGPEFLDLPRGATVTPLEKMQQPITITINNPTILNDRDAEKLGDVLVRALKMNGIVPRGV